MPVPDWEKIWGDTVEIIANSGIQFLDFDFKLQDVKGFHFSLPYAAILWMNFVVPVR